MAEATNPKDLRIDIRYEKTSGQIVVHTGYEEEGVFRGLNTQRIPLQGSMSLEDYVANIRPDGIKIIPPE